LQAIAVTLFGRESFAFYRVLVGKPDGKITLGRPRCRWKDGIKRFFKYRYGVWIGLVWLRMGTCGGVLKMR
jgi:hypothetical protein